jgi:chromosome segregation ATPase
VGGGAEFGYPAHEASLAQRFQEPPAGGRTAVESAIELSEKYAKLSEQAAELGRRNQELASSNAKLQEQMSTYKAQLGQTQQELDESNELLSEVVAELNQWKSNVMGFREEMRDADEVQLETLLKILEVLGGEVTIESVSSGQPAPTEGAAGGQSKVAKASAMPSAELVGPQLGEASHAGEHDK